MQYPLYRIDSFFFLLCYIPKSSTQVCTVSSETPEENLSPSNQFPVPAASANNSPLSPKPELEKVQKGTTVFPVKSFASINLSGGSQRFFRCEPSEVSKNERMKLITLKTKDGEWKGNLSFYCRVLHVSRQGFYQYLANKDRPWKYQLLAEAMMEILAEDKYNDTYGRIRMYQALILKQPENVDIPSERTVYRVMEELGLNHQPRRKPNEITKVDQEARKSEDLLKRDFKAEKPLVKCVTDITEIKASDGKLYVSAVFDCFDSSMIGLAMDTNRKAPLCVQTLENASKAYPDIQGAIIHSDRGSQYTSQLYQDAIHKYGIQQSMNSAGGRCHDNARCESMWGRMKSELLYDRYDTEKMSTDELRTVIWRYFISYWNNRRICSANGGLPPMVKRQQYYNSLKEAA